MKKTSYLLAAMLLPSISFAALYSSDKVTTINEAKSKILDLSRKYNTSEPGEICRDSNLFEFRSSNYKRDSLAECLKDELCINTQYEIRNIVPHYSIMECLRDAKASLIQAKEEAAEEEQRRIKEREEEKQKEADKLAAKQAEEQVLEAELKSGKRKPNTPKEAMIFYEATEGYSLASAPKIRPDMAYYAMSGFIHTANDDDSFIAQLHTGNYLFDAGPRYFKVIIPEELKDEYYKNAKIGSLFIIVGRYIDNTGYNTILGEGKSMPIFHTVYLQVFK